MAKLLLDACVPHSLRHHFQEDDVTTAFYAGLDALTDGELLDAIEDEFDVLVTLDRNLSYQQRVAGRSIAIIVLRVSAQTPEAFRSLMPEVNAILGKIEPGQTVVIGPSKIR